MRTFLRLLAAAAAVAAIGVTPASAVIGGSPDGNTHPYVGLSIYYDANGVPIEGCSGFLVSARVYVTAGHCAGPASPGAPQPVSAQVWFGSGPFVRGDYPGHGASCAGYTGFPCTGDVGGVPTASPGWDGNLPANDVGVVKLASPVALSSYAQLAPAGYLDALKTKRGLQDTSFTVVGYGVEAISPQGEVAIPQRFAGQVQLQKLTDVDVILSSSPGHGTGGSATCFGDSGGPVLNGGYVVALTSFGSKLCNSQAGAFRLDNAAVQQFIGS